MSTQFTGPGRDTPASQTAGTAKDEAAQTAQTAKHAAAQTADTTRQEAANVASTAGSAASDVVGTTKEQASHVAGEAIHQVRDLGGQVSTQLSEQAGSAAQKLAQALRSLAEELHQMGDHQGDNHGAASQAAKSLAARGDRFVDYLENRDPETMLTDARGSAARRPGGFLVGALVAGVLAGRFVRGNKAATDEAAAVTQRSTPTTQTSVHPTTARAVDPYGTTRSDAGLREHPDGPRDVRSRRLAGGRR